MSPASWRVKVCSLLFVVFLLWRAALGAAALAEELTPARLAECTLAFTLTEPEKIDRALATWAADPRVGLPSDHYPRLWTAIRDHVPTDAYVALVSQDRQHRDLTHILLCAIGFPRRFLLLEALPPGWPEKLRSLGQHPHVLEYATPADPQVEAACDLVASGDFFRIWRLRESGR